MSEARTSRATRARRGQAARNEEQERWKLSLLADYVAQHGWGSMNDKTVVAPGVQLGRWVARVRSRNRARRLPPWLRDGLEAIPGWTWEPVLERQREVLAMLADYLELAARIGHPASIDDIHALGKWIRMRRTEHRAGKLGAEMTTRLAAIPGWTWEQWPERPHRS